MAITSAEATHVQIGTDWDNIYRERLNWAGTTNRDFEGDVQTANRLTLHQAKGPSNINRTVTTVDHTTATGRDVALPAHVSGTEDQLNLYVDKHHNFSIYETAMDILESYQGILPKDMQESARVAAEIVNEDIRSVVTAAVPNAQDGEETAGLRRGDGDHYIPNATGEPTDAEARGYFISILRTIGHVYRANNYWKLGVDEYQPYVMTDNAMATAFQVWVDEEKPTEDITNSFLRSDGVQVGGVFRTVKEIPIQIGNDVPLVEVSNKDYHQILVHSPSAVTAAFRTPWQEINEGLVLHQAADGTLSRRRGWTLDGEARWGRVAVNPELLYRYLVRAEA